MKVIWIPFAQNEVRKTARYINWIAENQIEVVDFWDVRRDPMTLKNQI